MKLMHTFLALVGTPKMSTALSPAFTRGPRAASSLFTPYLGNKGSNISNYGNISHNKKVIANNNCNYNYWYMISRYRSSQS